METWKYEHGNMLSFKRFPCFHCDTASAGSGSDAEGPRQVTKMLNAWAMGLN